MIDIHPTHHGTFTLRDFCTHLFIVVLGILIALGLEQAVEYLHHRDQCHQLEANMRAEAQRNIGILTVHLDVNIPNLLWYRSALNAVRTATPKAGFIDVTLPPPFPHPANEVMIAPERNVWQAAKAAGTVVLLPDDSAQVYAGLDSMSEEDDRQVERIRDASALVERFNLATGERVSPGMKLHLSADQRDQLVLALSTEAQSLFDLLRRDNLFLINCKGVVSGIHDTQTMFTFFGRQHLLIDRYR